MIRVTTYAGDRSVDKNPKQKVKVTGKVMELKW